MGDNNHTQQDQLPMEIPAHQWPAKFNQKVIAPLGAVEESRTPETMDLWIMDIMVPTNHDGPSKHGYKMLQSHGFIVWGIHDEAPAFRIWSLTASYSLGTPRNPYSIQPLTSWVNPWALHRALKVATTAISGSSSSAELRSRRSSSRSAAWRNRVQPSLRGSAAARGRPRMAGEAFQGRNRRKQRTKQTRNQFTIKNNRRKHQQINWPNINKFDIGKRIKK